MNDSRHHEPSDYLTAPAEDGSQDGWNYRVRLDIIAPPSSEVLSFASDLLGLVGTTRYEWTLEGKPMPPVSQTAAKLQALEAHTPGGISIIMEENCINCDAPVDTAQPHRVLMVSSLKVGGSSGGEIETLERWPLCPNCETTQGVTLTDYVKYKLS